MAGALAALLLVIALGLYVKSYHDSGPTKPDAGVSTPPDTSDFGLPGASPSGTATTNGLPARGAITSLPQITITGYQGGGLVFAPGSQHTVVLSVHSSAPVGRVGYIVPTSPSASYGDVTVHGTTWTLTTQAFGKPAYALIFIQTGQAGTPITCSVTVDGHLSNTETTSGEYGRQVCLG